MIPEFTWSQLISRYKVVLLDAYGVLVHSHGALPGSAEFLKEVERRELAYCIVTNDASKLPETASKRYQSFGLSIDPERIVASGLLLEDFFRTHNLVDAPVAVLGPRDSVEFVSRAGGKVVSPQEHFRGLVIADERDVTIDMLDEAFTKTVRLIEEGRPPYLIAPNPDLLYPKGNGFGFAAGSLVAMFESGLKLRFPDKGFRFHRLGKPYPYLLEKALFITGGLKSEAVMLGDQLHTDIKAALAAGIDSVLVGSGITDGSRGREGLDYNGLCPTYWLPSLREIKP